jgi:hypothetical protein
VRGALAAEGLAFDTALVSLDLARALVKLGKTDEVKTIARHLVPIFTEQKAPRELLATLSTFRQAAERETLSVEILAEFATELRKFRQTGTGNLRGVL